MLVRGKYVLTDGANGKSVFQEDAAVLICQDTIREIGPYEDLHRRYPQEDVAGDGTQLLMPGLIDAHTHGAGRHAGLPGERPFEICHSLSAPA